MSLLLKQLVCNTPNNFIKKPSNYVIYIAAFGSYFVKNLNYVIMKSLSIIFFVLVFASCQKQRTEAVNQAKQESIDSMKTEINKQKEVDSLKLEIQRMEEKNEHQERASREKVTAVNKPIAEVPAKKKGWSGAAKGAVIGAGVGAATGAIVSKKKGQGAIIGGLLGAGVGAGTGAIVDDSKKNKE